jgi:hypothetical protein
VRQACSVFSGGGVFNRRRLPPDFAVVFLRRSCANARRRTTPSRSPDGRLVQPDVVDRSPLPHYVRRRPGSLPPELNRPSASPGYSADVIDGADKTNGGSGRRCVVNVCAPMTRWRKIRRAFPSAEPDDEVSGAECRAALADAAARRSSTRRSWRPFMRLWRHVPALRGAKPPPRARGRRRRG